MNTVIYSRVSTQSQDNQRQINELQNYASSVGMNVNKVFQEVISGVKKNIEREGLSKMISFVKANNIQKVLVWEMSRLGRNTQEVLNTIGELTDNGISLFIKNYNLETLKEDGSVNPLSQFMIQILSSVSEMERTQIRQRIKSGYDNYRNTGGKVGRKKGYKKNSEELLEEHNDIVKLIRKNISVRNIMKITGKSSGTVQKVKKLIQLKA
jgi:DNA invertase Pin-like site-specific DNA recombinase